MNAETRLPETNKTDDDNVQWGDCSNDETSCCGEDTVCFKDGPHTACVPKQVETSSPTSKPTQVKTSSPTSKPTQTPTTSCTICDDIETPWMIDNGFDCAVNNENRMNKKCKNDAKWTEKGWCRLR